MPGCPAPEQNPAHQIDALVRAGIDAANIHTDHAGGAKASRPQLDAVLARLRGGDTPVITRLDRLGRSVLHLINLGAELRERGIGLKVLEQGIDTATVEGRAMFGMLSVLVEFQRELIVATPAMAWQRHAPGAAPAVVRRNCPANRSHSRSSCTTVGRRRLRRSRRC